MSINAPKDQNDVSGLLGLSNADTTTAIPIYADPVTHRLLVDVSGTGTPGATGATGPQGPTGSTGAQGQTGNMGPTGGATGAQGPTGPTGASGNVYATTSTTSNAISVPTTALTFTVATGLSWTIGQSAIIAYDTGDYMVATVTNYVSGTGEFDVTVTYSLGSGTYTSWQINLDGAVGARGATGPTGSQGIQGTAGTNGTNGSTGPQGPTGSQGIQGTAGTNGTNGATGPTGPSSITVNTTGLSGGTAGYVLFNNTSTVGNIQASATPAASIIAEWDANVNMSANNFIEGWHTQATATGTTALSVTSAYQQYFTGSDTQTVTLPTTGVAAGQQYWIVNNSTGAITVQSSGTNTVLILAASTSATFTALKATPTAAADWGYIYNGVNTTSAKVGAFSNSITIAGTDGTTMTFPGTSKIVAANDGSNMTVASQATGDLFVSTSDTAYGRLADVAANSPLLSGGLATLPAYASWTMGSPSTAGNYLRSDGTNWYSSGTGGTLTVATTPVTGGTSTYVLYDNAGTLGNYNISGTGNVAMTTSPSFTTPILGTPTSGTLTNCTGLPAAGVVGTAAVLGANAFTGAQTFVATVQTVTAMAAQALNGALGNVFTRTLAASETFTQSGFTTGQCFIVEVKQGSGTSYTVTWFSGITWVTSGGTAPTQTTTTNGFTTYGFRCTGSNTFLGYLVGTQ